MALNYDNYDGYTPSYSSGVGSTGYYYNHNSTIPKFNVNVWDNGEFNNEGNMFIKANEKIYNLIYEPPNPTPFFYEIPYGIVKSPIKKKERSEIDKLFDEIERILE